jgi:hypothetical protein
VRPTGSASIICKAMPRDDESQSPLIRRTAWSGLSLLAGWLLFKALDLGGSAGWRALRIAGGWPLALAGVTVAALMLSVALGVAAGRIRLPVTHARIWGSWLIRNAPYALRDLISARKVSRGAGNRRWTTEQEFEREDPRRVGGPDQLHSDFGHWRDVRLSGGIRVSFIHATGEIVAVALGADGCSVELLGYARDNYHAEQLLEDWAYAHSLRWARYRCRGWKVPLEPRAQWWKEFDRRPPRRWPEPPPPSVGRRVGAYHGHSQDINNTVEVVDEAGARPLYHAVDCSPTGLAWGYGGSGPTDLSRSFLLDRLGYVPQPAIVYTFRDDVVAHLASHFVLTFEDVDAWIAAHGSLFAEDPRAEPLNLYAAGGPD